MQKDNSEYSPATVHELIDYMAERQPEETALISPDAKQELGYRQLRDNVAAIAHNLIHLGLRKGDKVSFMLGNGLSTVELFFGIQYGGFVCVPLNITAGQSQLAYTLAHSDTRAVFVAPEYMDELGRALDRVPQDIQVIPTDVDLGPDWTSAEACENVLPTVDGQDDALLGYTSGTSGMPKGVLVSHRNMLAGGMNTVRAHKLSSKDRSLCVLPVYHMNAQVVTLMATLLSGGSVVIPHRFQVSFFWGLIATHACTWFAAVPTILAELLHWTGPRGRVEKLDLRQLRFGRSSSAPLAPSLHREFEEKFKIPIIEAMGLTEAGGAIFSNPLPPAQRKYGSPGIPYGVEAKIVDNEGKALPPGQNGEILVRAESVMKCYHKNPAATTEALQPGGWLYTGDVAYMDADGFFHIIGRAKELINKGGEKIAPREIDETLCRHPAVLEAAAVGMPDEFFGEDIAAYVTLQPGKHSSEQELLEFCERELGNFKTPTKIYFVEDLPKGSVGKLQRHMLVEWSEKSGKSEISVTCTSSRVGDLEGNEPEGGFVAPRTPVEQMVAGIWAALFDQKQVGVHDNFFELGGYSMLAMQILSRLRKKFSVNFPLHRFFECPTVAQQAMIIDEQLFQNNADEEIRRLLTELGRLSNEEASSLLAKEWGQPHT